MAGQPKRRAREAADPASGEQGSRARAPRARPAGKSKGGKPSVHGPRRPRFEPASPDDFARVREGVARAAAAADRARKAGGPKERAAALEGFGLKPTGRAAADKQLLDSAARVKRDEGIVAAWALGLTPPTIATQFDLSADHVGRIIDAHRQRRARQPLPLSGDLLHDALDALEAQMERATLVASGKGVSDAAKVGAIRTWQAMFVTRLELLQAMGHVSQSPSAEARLARARDLLRGLLDGLRAEGVDQDVIDRVAARVLNTGGEDLENVVAIEARPRPS